MVDIDKLRGVPKGTTKKSPNVSSSLKKAAIALTLSAAALTPGKVKAAENTSKDDETTKTEQVITPPTNNNQGFSIHIDEAKATTLTNAWSLNPQDIEIVYDNGAYVIEDKNNQNDYIIIDEDSNEYIKREKESLKELFSRPTEYKEEVITAKDMLTDNYKSYGGYYESGENSITIVKYDLTNMDKDIDDVYGDYFELKDEIKARLNTIAKSPHSRETVITHEESHRDDDQLGIDLPGVSAEHRAKLDMLSEIKANMTQAGLILQNYQKKGNLSELEAALCNVHPHNVTNIRSHILENTPDCKKKIAKEVFDGWLKQNNVEGTTYWEQAASNIDATFNLDQISGLDIQDKNYQTRVNMLFSNVKGLGDVRDCVNPDFALEENLQTKCNNQSKNGQSAKLVNILAQDAPNTEEAVQKIITALKPIKEADKDGVRTKEEQKSIDKHIARLILEKTGRASAKTTTTKNNNTVEQTAIKTQTPSKLAMSAFEGGR